VRLENFLGGVLERILLRTTMLSTGFVLNFEGVEESGFGAFVRTRSCVKKNLTIYGEV